MSNIICETRGHVLLIGLNRPEKRNAVTPDMYYDMALAWGIDRNPKLRCGLLMQGDHLRPA